MITSYVEGEFLAVADESGGMLFFIALPVGVQQIDGAAVFAVPNGKADGRGRLDPAGSMFRSNGRFADLTQGCFILASQGSFCRISGRREIDDLSVSEGNLRFVRQ